MVISSPARTVHPLLMADWVHCNACFTQPNKCMPFFITSCGHLYCKKCLVKATADKCQMCGSKCSTLELTGNMKPDIQMYFQDPFDQLSKALKKCTQMTEFQQNHRRRFFTHIMAKLQDQSKMLMEVKTMMASAQLLEREVVKLKEENIYLKKLVQEKGIGSGSGRPSPRSGCSPTHPYRSSPSSASQATRYSQQTSGRHNSSSKSSNLNSQCSNSQMLSSGSSSGSSLGQSQRMIHYRSMTPDRILARTPPSGGRMGSVGSLSPADSINGQSIRQTPQTVPRPVFTPTFHGTPDQ